MIDDVEKQIYEVASKFAFVEKAETLLKTPNTIKIKLSITSTCFIQIYQNVQKNVKNYVVVFGNQRLFGRDCDVVLAALEKSRIWRRWLGADIDQGVRSRQSTLLETS